MCNNIIKNLIVQAEYQMNRCIENFKEHIKKIHIGRVSPNMLDGIQLEYYGKRIPISQLTNVIVKNVRTLIINIFDPKMIKAIEKSILLSELGVTPIVYDKTIRIILPELTEDRRRALIKMVYVVSEKSKISIRKIRRVFNEKSKILFKNRNISLDEERNVHNEIQKITDVWIKEIDFLSRKKEIDLMRF